MTPDAQNPAPSTPAEPAPAKPSTPSGAAELAPRGSGAGTWIGLAVAAALVAGGYALMPTDAAEAPAAKPPPPMAVTVIDVPRGKVRELLRTEGTVRAVRREFMTFEASGRVTWVATAEDGEPVRPGMPVRGPRDGEPGQLLAKVDARDQSGDLVVQEVGIAQSKQDVRTARANVTQAKTDLQLAETQLKRAKRLYEAGDTPLSQVEEAEARVAQAKATLSVRRAGLAASKAGVEGAEARADKAAVNVERTAIRAPFDGVLAAVNVRVGDYQTAQSVDRSSESRQLATAPFTVVDPSEVEVTVELPAFEAARVEPGQLAVVMDVREALGPPREGVALEDLPISLGRVFSVARAVDADSRTVRVRIRTRHNVERLQHGQFATCIIVTAEARDVVSLPLDAILFRDGKPHVFVVDEATGKVSRRALELGLRGAVAFEVAGGVAEGDKVVMAGRFRLVDGQTVRVTETLAADLGFQGDAPPPELLEKMKGKAPGAAGGGGADAPARGAAPKADPTEGTP